MTALEWTAWVAIEESKNDGVIAYENNALNLPLYKGHYKSVEVGKDGHCEKSLVLWQHQIRQISLELLNV